MTEILVRVGEEVLPLTKCVWVLKSHCGCATGALTAAFGDEVFATEEQAWKEFEPLKRERERRQKTSTIELLGWDAYREQVDLAAGCPHVEEAGTLDEALREALKETAR